MDVAAFDAEFRRVTNDLTSSFAWSAADVVTYLNDAINEACERAYLLEDRTTASCCTITLLTGVDTYALNAKVIAVKRAVYKNQALEEVSVEAMDARDSRWEGRTGEPVAYILTDGFIRFTTVPTILFNGLQVALTVYRRPLIDRTVVGAGADTAPEVNDRFHLRLMDWIYYRAYSKRDAESYMPAKAADALALFTANFGVRRDANVQRKIRDRRPPAVRFNSSW